MACIRLTTRYNGPGIQQPVEKAINMWAPRKPSEEAIPGRSARSR